MVRRATLLAQGKFITINELNELKECVLDNILIASDICFYAKCGIVWKNVECVEGSVE